MEKSDSNLPLSWSEENSQEFIHYGNFFVPDRSLQMSIICQLIPNFNETMRVLELSCGEGLLAQTILKQRPEISIIGLDTSDLMIHKARQRLSEFGSRFQGYTYNLIDSQWRKIYGSIHTVISSLAIHHLCDQEKKQLYKDIFEFLKPDGALIISDLIEPTTNAGKKLAANMWDQAVKERSLELNGNFQAFEAFEMMNWNLYKYPDEMDMPSTIYNHLNWLNEVGFIGADVYWMKAGHVIYGGVKRPA